MILRQFATRDLQQGNPDVGVRQKGHYQGSLFSKSPCTGRSNGPSPNSCAIREKKSGGQTIGADAAILGFHQFQRVADQFFQ